MVFTRVEKGYNSTFQVKIYFILFILFFVLFQVRNPDKYNWDPKWLLSHLVDIYLHLDSETLAAAMANDQRSFSIELFSITLEEFDGR